MVHSFRRRRAENDRSQATLVTGIVKNIVNMVCIAGKRDAFEFARASVAVIVGFKMMNGPSLNLLIQH